MPERYRPIIIGVKSPEDEFKLQNYGHSESQPV